MDFHLVSQHLTSKLKSMKRLQKHSKQSWYLLPLSLRRKESSSLLRTFKKNLNVQPVISLAKQKTESYKFFILKAAELSGREASCYQLKPTLYLYCALVPFPTFPSTHQVLWVDNYDLFVMVSKHLPITHQGRPPLNTNTGSL